MSRVYNFSAGPAMLPEEVLRECAEDMMNDNGSGQSVMEMSQRSIHPITIRCFSFREEPRPSLQ